MAQETELTRVKARIKALTEKTVSNGCTEAEAMSAAEMVGRLLERYALSMDEIDVRATQCVQREVPAGGQRRRPIDGCVPAIARFCDCKVWLDRAKALADGAPGEAQYAFFGFEPDAELAIYLFGVIDGAVDTELARFRRANRALAGTALRQASVSFQHGMVARVAARLAALHEAREASVGAQRSTGTALTIVKHGVVEEAFRQTQLRLVSRTTTTRRPIDAAYRHGWSAGEEVNLNRPVQGREPGRLR